MHEGRKPVFVEASFREGSARSLRARLIRGEVHVWRARLVAFRPRICDSFRLLSLEERERARSFHFERDRERFVRCRAILRMLLCRYLDQDPARLEFNYGIHGKPALRHSGKHTPIFNLSHSGDLALYAISAGRNVGIDVEYVRPISDADAIMTRYFPKNLNTVYQGLPREERLDAFFRAWTCREAYVKAIGSGLGDARVSVEFPDALILEEGEKLSKDWSLQIFRPELGHMAALAVEGRNYSLRYLEW